MIKTTTKKYKTHTAISIEVDGKNMGWLQIEKDNLAYYRQTVEGAKVIDHGNMIFINYSKSAI